jgi:hypothetical protein
MAPREGQAAMIDAETVHLELDPKHPFRSLVPVSSDGSIVGGCVGSNDSVVVEYGTYNPTCCGRFIRAGNRGLSYSSLRIGYGTHQLGSEDTYYSLL